MSVDISMFDAVLTTIGIFTTGAFLSFFIVAQCIYEKPEPEKKLEEKENYDEKYYKLFQELETKKLEKENIEQLKKTFLREITPNEVEVIMCYDNDSETFNYWSDSKNVKFFTLDAVAQKYSIDNLCKELCVDYKKEYDKALKKFEEKQNKENKENKENEENDENKENDENDENKKSVFAKFKSYNTVNKETTSDENDSAIIPEKCNRFKHCGKISEWQVKTESNEKNNKKQKNINMEEWLKNRKLSALPCIEEEKNSSSAEKKSNDKKEK